MSSRTRQLVFGCISVIISAALVGCGGGGSASSATKPVAASKSLSSLVIQPSAVVVALGNTQQLTVTATYSDGTTGDVTTQAKWTVTPSSVASVSVSGLLTSLAQGSGNLSVVVNTVSSGQAFTVGSPLVKSLVFSPSSLSIPMGSAAQLSATALYTDGSTKDLTQSVSWTSSPQGVVSVSPSGSVQSLAKGSFAVTGTLGSVSNSESGSVGNAVVNQVQVQPTSSSIPKGTTQAFSATAIYTDGSKQDVSSAASWQSTDNSVATVNGAGLATSQAQGSDQVQASYGGYEAAASLNVSAASIKSMTVTPGSASLAKGTTLQLSATAVLTDGSSQNVTSSFRGRQLRLPSARSRALR